MATGDGGRARDGKDIPPGSLVACTTNFDENFEGEVMAFDYGTRFIVIKIPSVKGTKKGNSDVRMLNISNLKNFRIIKESPFKPTKSLPALDLEKVERRSKVKTLEKRQAVNKVGVDVTPEGQRLFNTLSKQFNELHWDNKNIVVMNNSVIIEPPYTTESIHSEEKDENALNYIRGIVKKHCDNENES